MTATAVTPVRRDVRFEISPAELDGWHAEGRSVTHFINAMSVFFPVGERFFIHAVRHYRDRISDPDLAKAVTGFIGQEALHGREHEVYNAALEALGYPAAEQEQRVIALLEFVKQRLPKSMQLSGTIALEHFTAMLADLVLKDERMMAGASPKLAALWRWHALEETEHKAVAYDVWKAVMPNTLGSYLNRTSGLIIATVIFLAYLARHHQEFVAADVNPVARGWRDRLALPRWMFLRPAPFTRMVKPWLDYFKPGFHPWDHDNRAFLDEIASFESRLSELLAANTATAAAARAA
jgi:uncharacterized protein